jgi:hypothetical protein
MNVTSSRFSSGATRKEAHSVDARRMHFKCSMQTDIDPPWITWLDWHESQRFVHLSHCFLRMAVIFSDHTLSICVSEDHVPDL